MANDVVTAVEAPTSPTGQSAGGDAVASDGETSPGGAGAPPAKLMTPVVPTSPESAAQPLGLSRAPKDLPPVPAGAVLLSETVVQAIVTPPAGSPAAKRRASRSQVVDPRVSRAKFDQQVNWFRDYEEVLRRRGFLLIEAAFPRFVVAVCVPHVRPNVVLFAVAIDYTNWDLEPPSVRIVDPFTLRPLLGKELISFMKRRAPRGHAVEADAPTTTPESERSPATTSATAPDAVQSAESAADTTPPSPPSTRAVTEGSTAGPPAAPGPQPELCILQFGLPDEVPFLCLAGVREYHEHPAHTGDAWWLHRRTGAGSLSHLLNVFHSYAISPITGFAVEIALRLTPAGLAPEVRGLTLSTDLPA